MSSQIPERTEDGSRPYRGGDRSRFLDLYEAVWGIRKGADWFDWRFESNPYVEDVPIVVAEHDGILAGAEPCVVFRLRAGEETAIAFQPADWMVHPDYRRQGVFTTMTELSVDRYADGPPDLYYNFPSDAIIPGLENFDWRIVDTVPTHYRIQNPSAVAEDKLPVAPTSPAAAVVERGVSALARGYLGLRDRRARARDRTDVTVTGYDRLPIETLTSLYERAVPDRIHVYRDEAFYRWRFANPRWTTKGYVAKRGSDPVAGLVACTETVRGTRTTAILDVLPVDGSASDAAYDALLGAVVGDATDADVLKLAGDAIPRSVRRRYGFLPDDAFPLSTLTASATMTVRPASTDVDDPWRFGEFCLTDPDQWAVGLAGQDVA